MRESEAFIRSLPLKRRLHDHNDHRRYEIALVAAAKLIDDPATLKHGLAYMERHMRADPAQARYYALWKDLISRDPKAIVRELLADTDRASRDEAGILRSRGRRARASAGAGARRTRPAASAT